MKPATLPHDDLDDDALRPSGVQLKEKPHGERPTVPAPSWRVVSPDLGSAVFAQVVRGGRLAEASMDRPAIGSLHDVPYVISSAWAFWSAEVDHCRAFILGLVDGDASFEDIMEASFLPRHQVYQMFVDWLDDGVIAIR